ncbi:PKD domain-containing protein [Microbulbifer bruguierae]|uniref:PKD domain-containing protein n=1 Tax=Microbulbifer bruguierae TaxID=3029061 RepID=A0ABY8NE78_9GAMM|nr:PKD domain-containing protein [Microbulbifer bruguierae]WGL17221.1 PKD domain-containing protein [Microbulbifer bruguierae]
MRKVAKYFIFIFNITITNVVFAQELLKSSAEYSYEIYVDSRENRFSQSVSETIPFVTKEIYSTNLLGLNVPLFHPEYDDSSWPYNGTFAAEYAVSTAAFASLSNLSVLSSFHLFNFVAEWGEVMNGHISQNANSVLQLSLSHTDAGTLYLQPVFEIRGTRRGNFSYAPHIVSLNMTLNGEPSSKSDLFAGTAPSDGTVWQDTQVIASEIPAEVPAGAEALFTFEQQVQIEVIFEPGHGFDESGDYYSGIENTAVLLGVNLYEDPEMTTPVIRRVTVSSASGLDITVVNASDLPPVADVNGPYTGTAGSPIEFDGSGSYDPEGGAMSFAWDFGDGNFSTEPSPKHAYAVPDDYLVVLTVTDDMGNIDTTTTLAQVNAANQYPTANPGGPYAASEGESVNFDGAGSVDPDGNIVMYTWDFGDGSSGIGAMPKHTYTSAGLYTVTLQIMDDYGDSHAASTTVSVAAVPINTQPLCTSAIASDALLWPPNHGYRDILINNVSDPDGDPVTIVIDEIYQDELVDGRGDGSFVPDARGIGSDTAEVRAERSASGNGRIYHILFSASDSRGGLCSGQVTVGVPLKSKETAVDGGQLYDSTIAD